jgi:competence protein ComEC
MSINKKQTLIILAGLCFLNFFAWQAVFNFNQNNFLEIIFFDVGQGDAALIRTPENHLILIDGGPDSTILEKLAQEDYFWNQKIDLIVLTHFHKDHFFGLKKVIEKYDVQTILSTNAIEKTPAFDQWLEIISESKAEIIRARAGQTVKTGNFSINILYPLINLEGIEIKDANLCSIVLRIVFQDNSFLFMADAYQSIEKELISKEKFCQENNDYFCSVMVLKSDVLKVGHHGSKTSTSQEFVEKVSPEIAVISVGQNNNYGHPSEQTLDVLEKYDITVLRTDLIGDIKILSDGKNLKQLITNH